MLVGWVAYTDGRLMSRLVCGLAVLSFAPYILEPDTSLPWSVGFVLVWAAVRVLRAQRELLLELAAAQADLVRQSSAAERRRIGAPSVFWTPIQPRTAKRCRPCPGHTICRSWSRWCRAASGRSSSTRSSRISTTCWRA